MADVAARTTKPPPMTVDEFLVWVDSVPGKWELIDGEAVAMAPERYIHAELKGRIFRHLADAVERAGIPCEALIDGMGVRVTSDAFFQPDVFVRCGPRPADDDQEINDPIVVVEVASPSTAWRDETVKLHRYLGLASLRHYLLVAPRDRTISHHERRDDGTVTVRFWRDQPIPLDPPGIVLPAIF